MIALCEGNAVARLLDRVVARPGDWRQVDLCAPFIDGAAIPRLISLALDGPGAGCGLRVITSVGCAKLLCSLLPGPARHWRRVIMARSGLHAKAYLAVGRDRRTSEAIVTSANLTAGGLASNLELGVRATSSTDAGRRMVGDVRNYIGRLAA